MPENMPFSDSRIRDACFSYDSLCNPTESDETVASAPIRNHAVSVRIPVVITAAHDLMPARLEQQRLHADQIVRRMPPTPGHNHSRCNSRERERHTSETPAAYTWLR